MWNDAILIVDGKIAIAQDCCCGESAGALDTCSICDAGTHPTTITVTFGAGTDLGGGGAGCAVDCDDWATSWTCRQLTQAEINTINASWPAAFTAPAPAEGCYWGLTAGLPCSTSAMVVELLNAGAGGTAIGAVTICYPLGYVRLDFQITTAGIDDDCITNFDSGGTGCDNIGYSSAGATPCDFVGVLFDFSLMDILAA